MAGTRKVEMLRAMTGMRTVRMSLKSASMPAMAMRSMSPSEPRSERRLSKTRAVSAAVSARCPGGPRKLRAFERCRTRSRPPPWGAMSMPTRRRAMTMGMPKRRRSAGTSAIRAVRAMKRSSSADWLMRWVLVSESGLQFQGRVRSMVTVAAARRGRGLGLVTLRVTFWAGVSRRQS